MRRIILVALILLVGSCTAPEKSPEGATTRDPGLPESEPTMALDPLPGLPESEPTATSGALPGSPASQPTVTSNPLPDYLSCVIPSPGSRYSLAEYKDLAPSLWWNASEPGVCVAISPIYLLEPGDFPTEEEWLAQMQLRIDNQLKTEPHSLLRTDMLGFALRDPETEAVIGRAPDGTPFRVCYSVSLEPALHTATLIVTKTSGEQVSYSWDFLIVE